jgi:hypothetical protein
MLRNKKRVGREAKPYNVSEPPGFYVYGSDFVRKRKDINDSDLFRF